MEVESAARGRDATGSLKAQPIDGDQYPAELVVFAFPGGAGTVDANIERWRKLFKDKDGNPPGCHQEG